MGKGSRGRSERWRVKQRRGKAGCFLGPQKCLAPAGETIAGCRKRDAGFLGPQKCLAPAGETIAGCRKRDAGRQGRRRRLSLGMMGAERARRGETTGRLGMPEQKRCRRRGVRRHRSPGGGGRGPHHRRRRLGRRRRRRCDGEDTSSGAGTTLSAWRQGSKIGEGGPGSRSCQGGR
jgi:hypothetical protein